MKKFIAFIVLSFAVFSNAAEMALPTPQTDQSKAQTETPTEAVDISSRI
ncbi:MAG: hypothetical protein LBB65_00685 [Burkholderiales bacterium]|jgi:hypothetical protein|nr:hypothetical protein [Burkholderiales bacterium]